MIEKSVKIVGMMHRVRDELTLANMLKSNASIMGVSFSGENLSGYTAEFSWRHNLKKLC